MSMAFSNATDENHWEKMNANELAEILKENPTFIASLQNKVEQQELEIEQLKHKLSIEKSRLNLNIQAISKIKEQAKEIEELKEDLKNRNINIEYLKEKLIASISKQSLVEDLNDMHIARSIQKARDHRKFGEKK